MFLELPKDLRLHILRNYFGVWERKVYFKTCGISFKLTNEFATYCAKHGHLKLLKWARKNGCPWNHYTCSWAALNGHLNVLKYALKNGCNHDTYICWHAASRGHLHVLIWAIKNGYKHHYDLCRRAAEGGQKHILEWLKNNCCQCKGEFHRN